MQGFDFSGIIAAALVVIALVSIRISWTLKEIADALSARADGDAKPSQAAKAAQTAQLAASATQASEGGPDETELAAVIAIASRAAALGRNNQ